VNLKNEKNKKPERVFIYEESHGVFVGSRFGKIVKNSLGLGLNFNPNLRRNKNMKSLDFHSFLYS